MTINNGESGLSVRNKLNSSLNKLDGIEAGADVTDATNVEAAGAVMDADIGVTVQAYDANIVSDASYVHTDNNYTTTEKNKLAGIEAGATADQTKADIDALGINAATLGGNNAAYFTGYTDTAVANLVDTAPATLNTLNELAAALGDDPNFATTVSTSIGEKLANLVEDTTPQLGGNLDTNGNGIKITAGSGLTSYSGDDINIQGYGGSAGADISLQTYGDIVTLGGIRGDVKIQGITYPKSDGTSGQVLTTNGSGTLSFADASGGISNIVEDTTPQLGGTLDAQTNNITNAAFITGSNNLWLYTGSNGDIFLGDAESTSRVYITGTTSVSIQGLTYPSSGGTNGQVLTTNGSGTLSFSDKNVEIFDAKTSVSAFSTVDHNLNTAAVFRHTSIGGNFFANFTNADTTNNRTTSVALILVQGSTAYMPISILVDGLDVLVEWQGGSAPSGTANGTDVVSFTLIRSGGSWTAIGSATGYS